MATKRELGFGAAYPTVRSGAQAQVALYLQLANALGDAVRDGSIAHGQALPSERALCEQWGVSRVTARRALQQLSDQGLIERRHGSGNYACPRMEQALSQLSSFSDQLKQRGYQASSQWIARTQLEVEAKERVLLGLPVGAMVARLERIRLADMTPVAYEVSYLPSQVLPDPQVIEGSLYAHLYAKSCGPVRARQNIQAVNATAEMATYLQIQPGTALLLMRRVAYRADGCAIEVTYSWCRSDFYDFVAEMRN